MTKNPVLSELYEIRSRILADHGDDLRGYLHGELERLKSEGHPIADIKQRKVRRTGATKSGTVAVETLSSPIGERCVGREGDTQDIR
jgi:hypothetical protein